MSSSSSSSSSTASSSTSGSRSPSPNAGDGDANEDQGIADLDPTPLMNRTDNDAKPAGPEDQRLVYFWTWSGVDAAVSREDVARKIQSAYEASQATIQHMAVFRERHQHSQSPLEREWHFHVVVQTTSLCRWRQIAQHLRQQERASMHAATGPQGRSTYWSAFAYCYVPSAKKPLADLDSEYWLSPGHPDILDRLTKARKPSSRIPPLTFGAIVQAQSIRSVDAMYAYAQQQQEAGDPRWLTLCYQLPSKKLQDKINAVWAVVAAPQRIRDSEANHMDFLRRATQHICICAGRAIPGWEFILNLNGINVVSYKESLLRLFREGGGKGFNHYYYGAPSSGKTALTRPIIESWLSKYVVLQCFFPGHVFRRLPILL